MKRIPFVSIPFPVFAHRVYSRTRKKHFRLVLIDSFFTAKEDCDPFKTDVFNFNSRRFPDIFQKLGPIYLH